MSREEQLRIQALGAALSRRDWHATEQAYNAIRNEFDHRPQRSAATSKQVSAFGMMKANGDLLPCAVAEEDAIYHMCAPMFDVSAEYVRTKLEAAGWRTVRVQISMDPAEPLARNDRQTGEPRS